MRIEDEVLTKITPSKEEAKRIQDTVTKVTGRINQIIETLEIEAEPMLVGSVAKDTYLKKPDIDIFVMFPPSTKREDLEHYGLTIGRGLLIGGEERYAEHPYIHGNYDDYDVEIVPCYKVTEPSKKISAVDRTPFHTSYIIENLKEPQKDQVRLLKRFLKGIGIYGAEAEIEGFSGYLCELLIMKYGDFHGLTEQAKAWKQGTLIKLIDSNNAKFTDPLIVIDPVDPNRNVASALSEHNFSVFLYACKEYLKEPRMEFFFPNELEPFPIERIKEMVEIRNTTMLALTFKTPTVVADVLHPQLKKGVRVINQLFERYGFRVINSCYYLNEETLLLFELEVFSLPNVLSHKGPPVWHPNTSDFFEKWRKSRNLIAGPYIKRGCWYVDIKRDFRDAKKLLQGKILSLSLGKNVNEVVAINHNILKGDEIIKPKYDKSLTNFLDRRFAWEY